MLVFSLTFARGGHQTHLSSSSSCGDRDAERSKANGAVETNLKLAVEEPPH